MDAAATYTCSACGASTRAVVTGLDDPKDFVSDRDRHLLRQTEAVRPGKPAEDPVMTIEQRFLDDSARARLRFATCPRCGARNPEGIAAQASDARQTLLVGVAMTVMGVPLLWYVPWLTVVLGAGNVILVLVVTRNLRREGKPVPVLRLVLSVAASAAAGALGIVFPRYAPVLAVLWVIPTLLKRRRPELKDVPWDEAKATIRFEVAEG